MQIFYIGYVIEYGRQSISSDFNEHGANILIGWVIVSYVRREHFTIKTLTTQKKKKKKQEEEEKKI